MTTQNITLAAGCFWCVEAALNMLKGVHQATSGYMGGHHPNPSYRDICSGETGHAEVVQLAFDSDVISLETIFDVFFFLHDPTSLNRQGNDVGTQYRSAIFYADEVQLQSAKATITRLEQQGVYQQPIVTSLEKLSTFYPAETYHQGYALANPQQPYCQFLVLPKLAKFRQQFASLLKN